MMPRKFHLMLFAIFPYVFLLGNESGCKNGFFNLGETPNQSTQFELIDGVKERKEHFEITDGSGYITYSQYPEFLPEGTMLNEVTGLYSPSDKKILIKVNERYVEMALNDSLQQGEEVDFLVTRIFRSIDSDAFTRFVMPEISK